MVLRARNGLQVIMVLLILTSNVKNCGVVVRKLKDQWKNLRNPAKQTRALAREAWDNNVNVNLAQRQSKECWKARNLKSISEANGDYWRLDILLSSEFKSPESSQE